MGIFDIFSTGPAQAAAAAQTAGLQGGYNLASGNINQAIGALNQNYGTAGQQLQTNYTSALAPYLQNYGQAQAGVTQLGNVLGLNGPQGSGQALQTLTNTPGYQFALQQGQAGVNAAAQAGGTGASGNQQIAALQFGQGAATQNYNNYVNQLLPFLQQSNAAAGGINQTYQGLGQGLAANSQGLGQGLAGQYGNLANLGWQEQTGIGNANANADLAAYNASANLLGGLGGLVGGVAKFGVQGGGTLGGNAIQGLFAAEGGDAEAGRPYVVGERPRDVAKLRSYTPTYADKLARFLIDRVPGGEAHRGERGGWQDLVGGILGTRGLGDSGGPVEGYVPALSRTGLLDEGPTPTSAILDADRNITKGDIYGLPFDAAFIAAPFFRGARPIKDALKYGSAALTAGLIGEAAHKGYYPHVVDDDTPEHARLYAKEYETAGDDPTYVRPWYHPEKPEETDYPNAIFRAFNMPLQLTPEEEYHQGKREYWEPEPWTPNGYQQGDYPPVRRDGSWSDDLLGRLRLPIDIGNAGPMAPDDWDLGKFDHRGFQSGGYPPVGEDALVGEGSPPKPELFVPHDGSPAEWLGLNGPQVIVPQVPGTVIPNHALPYVSGMSKFMAPGSDLSQARESAAAGLEAAAPIDVSGPSWLAPTLGGLARLPNEIARGAIEESSKIGTPEQESYNPADVLTGASLGIPGLVGAGPGVAAQGLRDILTASPTATKAAAAGTAASLGLGTSSTQTEAEEKINPQVLELEQLRRQAEAADPRSETVDQLNKRAAAMEQAAAQSKYRYQGDVDRQQARQLQAQADELTRQIQADKAKAQAAYQNKLNELHTAEVAAAAAEARRLKDMPTAERYPEIGLAARTIATLAAAFVPYVHRNWENGQLNEQVTDEVSRLIRRAKGATSAGDVKELNRTIVALQKLKPRAIQVENRWAAEHGQPSRGRTPGSDFMRNFVLPGAGWGGLNVEAGMAPYQGDYFFKPEDSAAHRDAVRNMIDPGRIGLDFARGALMPIPQTKIPPYTALERPNIHDLEAIIKRVRSKKPALTVAP